MADGWAALGCQTCDAADAVFDAEPRAAALFLAVAKSVDNPACRPAHKIPQAANRERDARNCYAALDRIAPFLAPVPRPYLVSIGPMNYQTGRRQVDQENEGPKAPKECNSTARGGTRQSDAVKPRRICTGASPPISPLSVAEKSRCDKRVNR